MLDHESELRGQTLAEEGIQSRSRAIKVNKTDQASNAM
jgi:hypothetical protein